MKHADKMNMHQWLLNDEKSTTVLCSQCSNEKYDTLFMRKNWVSKDTGSTMKCDSCGRTYVFERRRCF